MPPPVEPVLRDHAAQEQHPACAANIGHSEKSTVTKPVVVAIDTVLNSHMAEGFSRRSR